MTRFFDWTSPESLIWYFQQIGTPFDWIIQRKWLSYPSDGKPDTDLGNVRVRIASSREDLVSADQLVTMRYGWRGYRIAAQDGTDRVPSEEASGCFTLLACREDRIVGTLTVGTDSGNLLVEELNPETIETLRRAGRRVVEFIRLAVQDAQDPKGVLYRLFRAAYERVRMLNKATDILIEVNPRHAAFYEKVFSFTVASGERLCPRVNAPAVLLRLDLAKLDERHSGCLKQAADSSRQQGNFATVPAYPAGLNLGYEAGVVE